MKLEDISKQRYRKNYNKLLIAVIVTIFPLALGLSHLLRVLTSDGEGSNFIQNISGPIIAAIIIAAIIGRFRKHPEMYEIMYVWNLKQELNRIYRKQRKILPKVDEGDRDAMVIMNFSYNGSRQLYELDDNKITMDELDKSMAELDEKIRQHGYEIRTDEYNPELLKAY